MRKITKGDVIKFILYGVSINKLTEIQATRMIDDIDIDPGFLSNKSIIDCTYDFKVSRTKLGNLFYGDEW